MTRANIYINDRFCGTLVEGSDGYTFRYDEKYICLLYTSDAADE